MKFYINWYLNSQHRFQIENFFQKISYFIVGLCTFIKIIFKIVLWFLKNVNKILNALFFALQGVQNNEKCFNTIYLCITSYPSNQCQSNCFQVRPEIKYSWYSYYLVL